MIADQLTQTPAARTARAANESLAHFLDEYPRFDGEPIDWRVAANGNVYGQVHYLTPDSARIVTELAAALHSAVSETHVGKGSDEVRSFSAEAIFDGTRVRVVGYLPLDAFTRFTQSHNPDPQEWTETERAEYAAFAGTAAA